MAILTKGKNHGDRLASLHADLSSRVVSGSDAWANVSMEGIQVLADSRDTSPTLANDLEAMKAALQPTFEASLEGMNIGEAIPGFAGKKYTEAQITAAALVAVAQRNEQTAAAYRKAAMNTKVDSADNIAVVGMPSNPAFGYSTSAVPSMEAFDAKSLSDLRVFNVLFAFSTAVQDEFGEAFYPTVTCSPDATGFEVSIRRTMVNYPISHPITGEVAKWDQKNLLDALTDPSILINESTRIYPQVIVGDAASEAHFVDNTVIAPKPMMGANGAMIQVAPIKAGKKINLIGAGANDRTNGTMDQTDAIDRRITVEGLYYRIKTAGGESVVRFNTKSFAQNGFNGAYEGRERRVILDFPTSNLAVSADTLDYNTGAPADALSFLNAAPFTNVHVNLEAHITGQGNLQLGFVEISSSSVSLANARIVHGANDSSEINDAATIQSITDAFEEIEFLGYDVKAYYTNSNFRNIGLLVDSVEDKVRYVIPMCPPISTQTPLHNQSTTTDMAGPMNAARMTNSLNAVTKILDNLELLREVTKTINYGSPTNEAAAVEGFARIIVRPTLYEDTLNIAEVITSTSSSNRTQDVQSAIVNKLRYGFAHIYTESRLQPAIDSYNGTAGERPEAVIGTDPKTAAYIMVNGDPRILGLGFTAKVVVSYDYRMRGRIYGSFTRNKAGEVDVLSHGVFGNIPELATQTEINYNGATTKVTQVQTRNLHVNLLPVALHITVTGLEQAAAGEVEFAVRQ